MSFIESIRRRARERQQRIVLPEGDDPRVLEAAERLAAEGVAKPIVLRPGGAPDHPSYHTAIQWVDPEQDDRLPQLAELLWERRRGKGMSQEDALVAARQPLLFGALLVAAGAADGSVAGAVYATGEVLRAAFWAIGPAPGIRTVSSSFYMIIPPASGEEEARVLSFTDAAVVPDPSPEQLAEIAIAAADARRRVVGDEPRVAFLSYSTHGSAEGPLIERVREAVKIFRHREPTIASGGELQADAALVPAIAERKSPGALLKGDANILVFPNLDAGNIGYKLVERLAGARAIGPIVQGLARPCNDLSRGASPEDIVNVACITALMAAG